MNETFIANYITAAFPKVETATNFGYTFFFYGSDHQRPFATLASSDNEHDNVSQLDRPGVFRLNLGVSKETFASLFDAGKVDAGGCDFTRLDVWMPHPDYAAFHFLCVLNPSEATWEQARMFLAEAYEIARRRNERAQGRE